MGQIDGQHRSKRWSASVKEMVSIGQRGAASVNIGKARSYVSTNKSKRWHHNSVPKSALVNIGQLECQLRSSRSKKCHRDDKRGQAVTACWSVYVPRLDSWKERVGEQVKWCRVSTFSVGAETVGALRPFQGN